MDDGDPKLQVSGNTGRFNNVAIARDTSGMTFWETVNSWFVFAGKVLVWIASFFQYWPLDERDMFSQNLIITYTPRMATCNFNNAGLMVNLPTIGIAQLTKVSQPGYTPFTLNFSCSNLLANGSTDRAIDMFLSSNDLLSTDNSVLVNNSPGAAQGVGIKVTKRETPNAPVVFSTSTLNRGNATSIFSAAAGAVVESNFSIGMGAYYFPYSPAQLTSGKVRATATLNIIYQ
jgi:type 1 fimbria pilin